METEQNKKVSIFKKPWLQSLAIVVIIFGLLYVFLFWQANSNTILIENSYLNAPIANLSPATPGILNAIYVKEGDNILPNSQVALVGSQILSTKDGGIVAYAPQILGTYFAPGQTVVSVVNEQEMKVIGAIDETKGLKDIQAGQRATFTVDAFPGKSYEGMVDEISPTSNDTSVVFSISDKRPVKNFDVKVSFNVSQYPELKNGMSAKITVYTK
jgi:multidrug resistance efflux pump